MTVEQIFESLGGPAAVGRAIGKTTEHAASMRRRRSIPVRYWPQLLQEAARQGAQLSEIDLTRAHAERAA